MKRRKEIHAECDPQDGSEQVGDPRDPSVNTGLHVELQAAFPPVHPLGLFFNTYGKKFLDSYPDLGRKNPFVHQQQTLARGICCYLGVCVNNFKVWPPVHADNMCSESVLS